MEFTTHNQQEIDTQGLTSHGTIETSAQELTNLFGKGMLDKPMWRVLFKDGNVAFIYPADGKHYYVEGRDAQAFINVQIALDLHREQIEAAKKKNPIEEALGGAFEMMDMLRATKGENYVRLVEIGMLIRKNQDILHTMIGAAISGGELSEGKAQMVADVGSMVSAKILALSARIAGIAKADKREDAEELMGWVDRVLEEEAKGAKGLIESLTKDGGE